MTIGEDASPDPSSQPPGPPPAPAPSAKQREEGARERRQRREHNNLVNVLATDDGRAFVWRILEHCRPYAANDKADEYQRGIQEGQRRDALWLLSLIDQVDGMGYAKMIEDNVQREARIADLEATITAHEQQRAAAELAKLSYWERFRRSIIPKSFG